MDAVHEHEQALTGVRARRGWRPSPALRILGPHDAGGARGGAISFELDGIHPHDVSQVLDERGVAVRAGHHCAKPLHRRLGVQATTRASFYLYTTPDEIDALVDGHRAVHQAVLQVA